MLIRRRRGWELPESAATPEALVTGRRALVGGGIVAAAMAAVPAQAQWSLLNGGTSRPVPVLKPLDAERNTKYQPKREITGEDLATSYNNFYEFGLSKAVAGAARALVSDPWSIEIAGMVGKPQRIAFDALLASMTLEERVYRHRCVEAWAMTVPWVGFPLAKLIAMAEPQTGAKYVVFKTLADPKTMPGLGQRFYPWPYTEGLTLAEATHELTFMSVGMYGKTLPPQNGAPLRLTVPWKYGFKSIKSIVRIELTDKRPVSFWETLQSSEYGFWANVNPAVAHPRWSQSSETLLGRNEKVPTQMWNGYGEYVAPLYAEFFDQTTGLPKQMLGTSNEKLFI